MQPLVSFPASFGRSDGSQHHLNSSRFNAKGVETEMHARRHVVLGHKLVAGAIDQLNIVWVATSALAEIRSSRLLKNFSQAGFEIKGKL